MPQFKNLSNAKKLIISILSFNMVHERFFRLQCIRTQAMEGICVLKKINKCTSDRRHKKIMINWLKLVACR